MIEDSTQPLGTKPLATPWLNRYLPHAETIPPHGPFPLEWQNFQQHSAEKGDYGIDSNISIPGYVASPKKTEISWDRG